MKQRPALTIVALAVWAAVTACTPQHEAATTNGDKSEKTAAPSPSDKSPSPSGTTGEEKGAKRTKLDAATKAKVQGAVGTYLSTLNKAYATGNTSAVKKLAHKECGFCKQLAGHIDEVYGKGGRIEGSQAGTPKDVKVSDLASFQGIQQVHFSAKVPWTKDTAYNKAGKVIENGSASVESVQFTLELSGNEWKIRTWELEQ